MRTLTLDIETYSSVSLQRAGVYAYAESPDFEVLLLGCALDDDPVTVIDVRTSGIPDAIREMLTDERVLKTAYNANFERVCLSRALGVTLSPTSWRCTMVHTATLGLPRSLADVCAALNLPSDQRKDLEGARLIRRFCVPCAPSLVNGGSTRNLPEHDPDGWRAFIDYNRRDVEAERAVRHALEAYPPPQDEWAAYTLDQQINDLGVRVDRALVRSAIVITDAHTARLRDEAEAISGLSNVGSVAQLKGWLHHDGSLDQKAIAALRAGDDIPAYVDRLLAIRQELGKTSVSKYQAIERCVCADGRVRGLFAFYGASRTGRWAGRHVQVQNLPQNHIPDLTTAREIALDGDREALHALYGNVPATLSELIRTAFIPAEGCVFAVADFSAIEARVLAWLANERWRQELFARGGKLYEASAERMFNLPAGSVRKGDPMRQKGKIAELALGYGGSAAAMVHMGALEMGLTEAELPGIVTAWREASPAIVALWRQIEDAALQTVRERRSSWQTDIARGVAMRCTGKLLHIRLPSGRELRYWKPRIGVNRFGRGSLVYWGTTNGQWCETETWGGKLTENIVQAIARDCLRDAMRRVWDICPAIVMHVHDEMVVEVEKARAQDVLDGMLRVMAAPIPWAKGLLLKGDGYLTDFYQKG